jgi:N-methylhydantoinase B
VRSRLREIPDGNWYAMHYHDHDGTTNAMYAICCRAIKEGERLVIDLTGTAPQSPGSINCARPAMEGAVFGVILTFLCYDLPWAIAGLRNVVEIVSEEGTWNNAVSPAAVSFGSTMGTISTHDVVAQAVAKMMLSSERYRDEAQANWTPGCNGSLLIAPNVAEEPSVGAVTDFFSGGGGARTFADGVDSGGIFHSMASQISNAETVESRVPVLQVYRRELADSGGPGRFRGGVSVEFATVPHRLPIEPAGLNTIGSGISVPTGRGLSGGHPGAVSRNVIYRGSNIRELFAAGHVPLSSDELEPQAVDVLAAKSFTMIAGDDVLVGILQGGGGYGDPLRREPARVAEDVAKGLVSVAVAGSVYGVVVEDGRADEAATAERREEIRRARLDGARAPAASTGGGTVEGGTVLHPVSDTVEAVEADGRRSLRCTECGYRYGAYEDDHKRAAAMRELPLTETSPHNHLTAPEFVLREFYCPGCATSVAVDVQRTDEELLDESRLAPRPTGA